MSRTKSTKVTLRGLFCFPTSTRFHCSEPLRSMAFLAGQVAYVLAATESEGYPPSVVLTSGDEIINPTTGDFFAVGDEISTQHPLARKNLPPRRVAGIIRADGSTDGDVPGKGSAGLPHWEYIASLEDGSYDAGCIKAAQERIALHREEEKRSKADAKAAEKK